MREPYMKHFALKARLIKLLVQSAQGFPHAITFSLGLH